MSRSGDKGPNLALRHERERRGWSQADLAEKIGVDVVSISRWERGTNTPTSAYTKKKVCDLFGKTPEELGFFSKTLDEPPSSPPMQEPTFEPRNPYKGLRAFRSEDAHDFFGRVQLIDELTDKLEKILTQKEQGGEAARLLAVIGPSGSGKSSVVMAGLVPRLQAGELPESKQWVYLRPMVPGTHPLEALAVTLWECLPERKLTTILEDLQDGTARTLHLLAASIGKQSKTKVVLVVDQFEELFVQTTDEQERKQFIDLLLTASTERDGSVLIILTLRADFYDRPMYYTELGKIIEEQSKSVFPMNGRELQAIIKQPAALSDVQLTFEGGLVSDLLSETQGQIGALPLLQFTLDQLFQRRCEHLLTLQAYQEIGGVKGALAKQAESTYMSLSSEEHRRLARALFLRLIDPGVTEQDTTRRRAALSELSLPDPKQTTILREVTDAFIAARLLTTNEIAGTPTIEVSHEALIREWPRLFNWLREAREDTSLQQVISADAANWMRRGRPVDRVYRGAQLVEAQAWAERSVPSKEEVAFLQASVAEHQQQETETFNQKARELALQRRSVGRLRLLLGVLSIFTIIVIVLASVAQANFLQSRKQQQQAELEAQIARARALIAQANSALLQNQLDLALLLSLKAYQTLPDYETRSSLLTTLEYSPHIATMWVDNTFANANANPGLQVSDLAFSRDSRILVSARNTVNGSVIQWDLTTHRRHVPPAPLGYTPRFSFYDLDGNVANAALSPDGQMVASVGPNWLELWNIKTGLQLAKLEDHSSFYAISSGDVLVGDVSDPTPIAFSPDGKLLALGRCGQYTEESPGNYVCLQWQIHMWNVTSHAPIGTPLIVQGGPTLSLAFSSNGKLLASGGQDKTIRLWDVATGASIGEPLTGHAGAVVSLAFSPDGKFLASGSEDKTIRLWDMTTRTPIAGPLTGHAGAVVSLAFSPDGKFLASGSEDKTVRLWDATTRELIDQPFIGHREAVSKVAFSPDGQQLASGSTSSIIIWNVKAQGPVSRVLEPLNRKSKYPATESMAFSPDGQILAAADGRAITLWNVTMGTTIRMLVPDSGSDLVTRVAFSQDGQMLASISGSNIILWNVKTGTPITHLTENSYSPDSIDFSPDGHTLAVSNENVAFSPDGHILAAEGTITLWRVTTMSLIRQLPVVPREKILLWDVKADKSIGQPLTIDPYAAEPFQGRYNLVFSPDGRTLATSAVQGITLWNVAKGTAIRQINQNGYGGLAFSPDGRELAFGEGGTLTIWDLTKWEPMAQPFNYPGDEIRSLAFSPDGKIVAAALFKDILLTDVTIDSWQNHACGIANRNFSATEWDQFAKGEPYQKVCPRLPVDGSVIAKILDQAHAAVLAGRNQDASSAYTQASQWAIESEDADISNYVCLRGSVNKYSKVVLPVCEYAVKLDSSEGDYYDGRGLARALTGNSRGAINDFKFYIQWTTENCLNSDKDPSFKKAEWRKQECKHAIDEQNSWIQELEAGRNPFDAKTLKAIAKEGYLE